MAYPITHAKSLADDGGEIRQFLKLRQRYRPRRNGGGVQLLFELLRNMGIVQNMKDSYG